jgi:hypothetical protein
LARPETIRWDTAEPYLIGFCCEARKEELIAKAREGRRLPIWALAHRRALEPLHKKRKEIGARQASFVARREEIRQMWADGKITEQMANRKWAALHPAIKKTFADAAKLKERFEEKSEKIVRGRGKKPHSRSIDLGSTPPPSEEQILQEAAAHFSKEFGRTISPRSIRSAWDWYRAKLKDMTVSQREIGPG